MSQYNLYNVSRTLARRIWDGIKDDSHIRTIITSEGQIIHNLPKDAHAGTAQVSVLLYSVTEMTSMRNQPQPIQHPPKPRILHHLNLRYLIAPLAFNAENDQVLLAKIMQILAEKPVLRESDLQGSLKGEGAELRVVLDDVAAEDLCKLWSALASPYKLSLSYSIFPVSIAAPTNMDVSQAYLDTKTESVKSNLSTSKLRSS